MRTEVYVEEDEIKISKWTVRQHCAVVIIEQKKAIEKQQMTVKICHLHLDHYAFVQGFMYLFSRTLLINAGAVLNFKLWVFCFWIFCIFTEHLFWVIRCKSFKMKCFTVQLISYWMIGFNGCIRWILCWLFRRRRQDQGYGEIEPTAGRNQFVNWNAI